jgi:hypothetical protein
LEKSEGRLSGAEIEIHSREETVVRPLRTLHRYPS